MCNLPTFAKVITKTKTAPVFLCDSQFKCDLSDRFIEPRRESILDLLIE